MEVFNLAKPAPGAVKYASGTFGQGDFKGSMLHWLPAERAPTATEATKKNFLYRFVCEVGTDLGSLLGNARFSVISKFLVSAPVFDVLSGLMDDLKTALSAGDQDHRLIASVPVRRCRHVRLHALVEVVGRCGFATCRWGALAAVYAHGLQCFRDCRKPPPLVRLRSGRSKRVVTAACQGTGTSR